MARAKGIIDTRPQKQRKKTRQGNGRGTKFSTRNSKRFKKKYRGQGKC